MLLVSFSASSQWGTKPIAVTYTASSQWNKNSVKVDKRAYTYWRALTHLYKKKGIKIDYTKIKSVKVVNNSRVGWVGLYDPQSRTITLNLYKYESIREIKHDTIMILILAHEMAHSQGIPHSFDKTSIMYPAAVYIKEMLDDGVRVTDLVMTPYSIKYHMFLI